MSLQFHRKGLLTCSLTGLLGALVALGAFAAVPVLGDLNGDGVVDFKDATLSLQLAVGNTANIDPVLRYLGDINNDGKYNIQDTLAIMKLAASSPGASSGGNPPGVFLGDLNGDGKVDIKDATLSLLVAIGVQPPRAVNDVNGDSVQNIQDTTIILNAAIFGKAIPIPRNPPPPPGGFPSGPPAIIPPP